MPVFLFGFFSVFIGYSKIYLVILLKTRERARGEKKNFKLIRFVRLQFHFHRQQLKLWRKRTSRIPITSSNVFTVRKLIPDSRLSGTTSRRITSVICLRTRLFHPFRVPTRRLRFPFREAFTLVLSAASPSPAKTSSRSTNCFIRRTLRW